MACLVAVHWNSSDLRWPLSAQQGRSWLLTADVNRREIWRLLPEVTKLCSVTCPSRVLREVNSEERQFPFSCSHPACVHHSMLRCARDQGYFS